MENNKSEENIVFARDSLSKYRIEALTDGVFAIVMTIMILELKFPEDIPGHTFPADIQNYLLLLLPKLENYAISFVVLGIYWIRHQIQFNTIKFADKGLIWINIIFLMFVALIPFTTSFMMNYPGFQLPIILYSSNLTIIGFLLFIHWLYATYNFKLIDKNVNSLYIKRTSKLNLLAPVVFILTIIISFFNLRISLTLMYTVPIIYIIFRNYSKVFKPRIAKRKSLRKKISS
jgi:uncharacterized membrane protein